MVVGSDDTGARSSNICLSAATGIHPAPLARPHSLGAMGLGLSHIRFYTARGIHPAPLARPFSQGLRDWGCRTLDFIRLEGSILRLWRGPSLGAYGIGVVTHWILYGYGDPSCADGAAPLWGSTGLGLSHIGFYTARGIHPAPLARPLSGGLRDWGCHTLDFIRLRGPILR